MTTKIAKYAAKYSVRRRTRRFERGGPERAYLLRVYNRERRRITELTPVTERVVWTTYSKQEPAKLTFSLLKTAGLGFWEGDDVAFYVNGDLLFKGFVFAKTKDDKGCIEAVCYDQLRYLRARQSYDFSGCTAGQIIKKIAADFQLKCGDIAETAYKLPVLLADDKTCLDTICRALEQTAAATGVSFRFFDEGGKLVLRPPSALLSPYILGDGSFTTGYSYHTSIDDEVYNYVKLVRPDESAGNGEAVVAKDTAAMARWGLLQLYKRVDGELNAAQLKEMAKSLLLQYDRLQQRLTLSCLGLPDLRAGQLVRVEIAELGEAAAKTALVAQQVTQRFSAQGHTMDVRFELDRQDSVAVSYDRFREYLDVTIQKSGGSRGGGGRGGSGSGDGGGSGGYRHPYHKGFRLSTPFGRAGRAWSCGWHTGADYVGSGDKKVYAIYSGRVSAVGRNGSYGNHVYVQQTDGYVSLYAHLSKISVSVGQRVGTDTQLGVEGATGNASGSHLHLELHKGQYRYPPDPKINPYLYIETHK